MKTKNTILFILMVLFAVSFSFAGSAQDTTGYGFDVSIVRQASAENSFGASFAVTDLSSNKIIMKPTILFRAGEAGQITSADPETGLSFQFSVNVDRSGSIAEYKAEAIKNNVIVSRSQARVSLSK